MPGAAPPPSAARAPGLPAPGAGEGPQVPANEAQRSPEAGGLPVPAVASVPRPAPLEALPPSQRWQQPLFITLLAVQATTAAARCVAGDPWGAAAMAALTLLGCLALAPRGDDIDQSYVLYYVPVAALQAIFDLALVADHVSRSKGHIYFTWSTDPVRNFKCILAVACPVVELLTATVCYAMQQSGDAAVSERTSLLSMSGTRQSAGDQLLDSATREQAKAGHIFKGKPQKLADWIRPEA